LILLIILALVAWGGRLVLAGLGAPAWLQQILLVVVLIVAVVVIANAFGIATPNLR
jgi:uncharacterized iron-regulated membrane protein